MQCPDCGTYYSEEEQFCGECGRSLLPETLPVEPSSTPRVEEQAAVTPKPAPIAPQPTRSRSRPAVTAGGAVLILLVLCIVGAVILSSILGNSASNSTDSVPSVGGRSLYLYHDDFRDPASGWGTWDEVDTLAKYVDGEYRLGVARRNYVVWSYPANSRILSNFVLEVDVRQVEGSPDSSFGPVVRVQTEEEHYYWFQISSDGYFSVELKEEGEWVLLHEWEASGAIKQGLDATNQIRVVCYGSRFSFDVNDTHLIDLADDTLRAGIIGLAAGAYTEPPVVISFDNLFVYKLEDY